MWETLRNAWKIQDLRKKILYTVGMLLVYRLLCYVPTPGVDLQAVSTAMSNYSLLGFIDSITGSNLANYTIMAMGITPYINSSIIMQLLTVAIPKLEDLQKQGEEGRKKIAQITRYVTIGLGFLQAIGITVGMKAALNGSAFSYITIGVCLAAGTALAMWIGERINEKGLGNGVSLLIFAGIISRVGPQIVNSIASVANGTLNVLSFLLVILGSFIMIVAVVFVDQGERRIPVQYAKRMVGRKMYGGQSTYIPMKINSTGVMPLIFGFAILQFPATIFAFFPTSGINVWWQGFQSGIWYQVVLAVLIIAFTYFYTSITFNPVDISKNMQQNGGIIPGIRQGRATSDYLSRVSGRLTLFSALFLAVLATIPTMLTRIFGITAPFGASSVLIAVSVGIETIRQVEAQMVMRHHKGFLG